VEEGEEERCTGSRNAGDADANAHQRSMHLHVSADNVPLMIRMGKESTVCASLSSTCTAQRAQNVFAPLASCALATDNCTSCPPQ